MKLVFGLVSAFLAGAYAIPALRVARDIQPEITIEEATIVEPEPEYAVAVEMSVEIDPNEIAEPASEADVDTASFYAELYEVEEANYGDEDDCYDAANADEGEIVVEVAPEVEYFKAE